jgi:hypothetical protein
MLFTQIPIEVEAKVVKPHFEVDPEARMVDINNMKVKLMEVDKETLEEEEVEEVMEVVTTGNFVICNHTLCNRDATACRMQLFLELCPLFGCVCNYGATMITFIPTFG